MLNRSVRTARSVGLLASSALLLSLVAVSSSSAADETAAGGAAPISGQATDTDADGVVDASDGSSAAAAARATGERVEDLSQRTASTSVFVNPDGSSTRRDFGAVVRVEKSGDWAPVDYTLVEQADGSYAPKSSDVDITIGGESAREAARVQLDGDQSLAFTWPTALPEPRVDGGVATYKLSEASDLVVAVTGNGVTARIRLNEEPATDDPAFKLGLRADSLDLEQKPATGALEITDQDGKTVGGAEQLLAWDSATDEAGDPSNVVELDANLKQTTTTGDVTNHSLELTAPDGFLSDPETEYPVTIDPNIRVGKVRDTWVRAGQSTTYGDDFRLIVGKVNGSSNTNPARSYLKFFDSRVDTNPNVKVTNATLNLWQYYGYSCADRRMYAMAAGSAWGDNLSWGSPAPGGTGTAAYVDDNRGASGCGQGWTKLDVTSMANAWNTGAIDNNGIRLHASDETLSAFERRFCSMDPVSSESICNTATRSPVLDVTYNTVPDDAEEPTAELSGSHATVSSVVSDSDGGQVRAKFVVKAGSAAVYSGFSEYVPSGEEAFLDLPPLADGSYTVQSWSNDGSLTSSNPSPAVSVVVKAREIDSYAGYLPVEKFTLVDTASGNGLPAGPRQAGSVGFVQAADGTRVPEGTTAVFATVRVQNPTAPGALKIGPSDASADKIAPTVQFASGESVQASGVIELGRDGRMAVTSVSSGTVDLVVDVYGIWVGEGEGATFTRTAASSLPVSETGTLTLAPGASHEMNTLGAGNVPDDGKVDAVLLDVAAHGQAPDGALTITGATPSSSFVVDMPRDSARADLSAIVEPSETGTITLMNSSTGDVTVALSSPGWFSGLLTEGTAIDPEARVLAPTRITDSQDLTATFDVAMAETDRLEAEGDRVTITDAGDELIGFYTFEVRGADGTLLSSPAPRVASKQIQLAVTPEPTSTYPLSVESEYTSLETIDEGAETTPDGLAPTAATCPEGRICTADAFYYYTTYKMLKHSKTKNVVNYRDKDKVGMCYAASDGIKCSISRNGTTSRSWGLGLGATKGWLAAQLNISASTQVTVTVGCDTKTLKRGQALYGRPVGSKHKYKIRKTVYRGPGSSTVSSSTTGWKYTYNPYKSALACEIRKIR